MKKCKGGMGIKEQEYTVKEQEAEKTSRDGLTEENLYSRKSARAGRREQEDLLLSDQAEDSARFSRMRNRSMNRSDQEKADPQADTEKGLSEHSLRMEGIRGRSSASREPAGTVDEYSHSRKKVSVI